MQASNKESGYKFKQKQQHNSWYWEVEHGLFLSGARDSIIQIRYRQNQGKNYSIFKYAHEPKYPKSNLNGKFAQLITGSLRKVQESWYLREIGVIN